MASSVTVRVPAYGYTYSFSGVLSVKHEFSLKISTEAESAYGSDHVNGARNQPDRVILTVLESDVGHLSGWSDRMLQAMESVKRNRVLCQVITSAHTYSDMLLSEFSATVDEESPSGWEGKLTFTKYVPPAQPEKTDDNSSTPTNTGSAGQVQTVSGSQIGQILTRAGLTVRA